MYQAKTRENKQDVLAFIHQVESDNKKEDALALLEIYTDTSGHPPKMWGDSIIGFGRYHYKYATGHEGDAPLVGFSPRKSKISLYFATGDTQRDELLMKLGKHTSGKACVYINKLSDIQVDVLKQLITQSIHFLQALYPEE